jgi:hypothetical protein
MSAAFAPKSSGPMPPTLSSVSAIARGCSKISFCMKWLYGPSSTASPEVFTVTMSRATRTPLPS